MKKFFFKKKINDSLNSFGVLLRKTLARTYELIFAKRTILFVTNEKIRSVNLGPVLQSCLLLLIAWVASILIQSVRYDNIVSSKNAEIARLESLNSRFLEKFDSVNQKLHKVNEYLISVTGKVHKVKDVKRKKSFPKSLDEHSMSEGEKEILTVIGNLDDKILSLQAIAESRIDKIEKVINLTGLNLRNLPQKRVLSKVEVEYNKLSKNNIGGPVEEDERMEADLKKAMVFNKKLEDLEDLTFKSEIDYLIVLEKLAVMLPLSRPMNNHYISSGFGYRKDPLTGKMTAHKGLDFVGMNKEKIISPSEGRVVLAGKYSAYGNAVVIDHGFGVTTRYGHLSKVNVKAGDFVKKGDVIAFQGNTGRSTGAHLHYEVRYKNTALNPRKFINAGEVLFGSKKYADG